MTLSALADLGVTVELDGSDLVLDAPPGVLTAAIVGAIRDAKPALLAELSIAANDRDSRSQNAQDATAEQWAVNAEAGAPGDSEARLMPTRRGPSIFNLVKLNNRFCQTHN